jgi:protease I
MAQHSLSAKKMAIMLSAGFDETQFINIQKSMMANNAWLKVVSNKSGLVNGANNGSFGMAYPVDAVLSETLAIDYDGLIIPGGAKHIAALAEEPHALRILRAFLREDMAVLVIDEAADLLAIVDAAVQASDFDDSKDIDASACVIRAKKDASISEALGAMAGIVNASEEDKAA